MISWGAKQYTQAVGPWREFLPIIDAPWPRRSPDEGVILL
jgi:hypothetical protein